MKTQITLDSKESKALIAKALGIEESHVVPLRYNFAVEGYTEAEVKQMLISAGVIKEN